MASTDQHPVLRKGRKMEEKKSDRDTVNIQRGSAGNIVATDGSMRNSWARKKGGEKKFKGEGRMISEVWLETDKCTVPIQR